MGFNLGALFENQTLCGSGNGSFAVFGIVPIAKGRRTYCFKGIVSELPRRKYVIKVFRDTNSGSNYTAEQLCEKYLNFVEKALTMKEKFGDQRIRFLEIRYALMDRVSPFMRSIKSSDGRQKRHLDSHDTVVFEQNLGRGFKTYIDRDGTVSDNCPENLQELVHFVYKESSGKEIMTGLKGISLEENQILKLTSPSFHSVAKTYGPDDIGERAILNFFAYHKCTKLCSQWPKPVLQYCSASF